jgi:hypothetical protein
MKIKNWTKFQHFKDRRPPWVKLYRDILDDIEWHELDPLAAKVLVMLWLIASEDDGRIPDTKTLAFRLRLTEVKTKEVVIKLSHWLEQDDINVISDVYQHDPLETERETETETKKDKNKRGSRLASDFCFTKEWEDFCQQTRPELSPVKTFDQFKDYWIAQAGQKGVKLDWFATWRNWVRSTSAPKQNPYDVVRLTVPSKNEPDPALEKIKADDKKAVPPSLEVLAKMAQLRKVNV